LRPRELCDVLYQLPRPRDEAAGGTGQCLAERSRHDIDGLAKMLDSAPAAGADGADAVRIVDDDRRIVLARQRHDAVKPGKIAFHREHAVGNDE
jgi:hypothetical protein